MRETQEGQDKRAFCFFQNKYVVKDFYHHNYIPSAYASSSTHRSTSTSRRKNVSLKSSSRKMTAMKRTASFKVCVAEAKPRALISVSDKTNLDKLASGLVALGYEVISTGGSAKFIQDKNIPVTSVDGVTSFPEMLDGRVKTLHPGIHGGILAKRDNETHMKQRRCELVPVSRDCFRR